MALLISYDKRESENDMRPVNLYLLTRNQNKNTYTPFENIFFPKKIRYMELFEEKKYDEA